MKGANQLCRTTPSCRKRRRLDREVVKPDLFDLLPDELVASILCKLISSARSPSDFFSLLLTCKRLNCLASHPLVLRHAGDGVLSIKAASWSATAHRFLDNCVKAGSSEACYMLGMIRFYCLQKRLDGKRLLDRAANNANPAALYSLAIIEFNGSGASKAERNLRAGVMLCARASLLGHIDAIRELGHCLKDGYGVPPNTLEGRRLLFQANARELFTHSDMATSHEQALSMSNSYCYNYNLLSDFGCNVPLGAPHPANQFLLGWFGPRCVRLGCGLRMCSHDRCGRPETRPHEFRRCSVCGSVNYCSRACQTLDWKVRHRTECVPLPQWLNEVEEDVGEEDDNGEVVDDGDVVDESVLVID